MSDKTLLLHLLRPIKAKVALAQRSELEQSALRVAIGGLVLVYLTWYATQNTAPGHKMPEVLAVAIAFFLFAVVLWWLTTSRCFADSLAWWSTMP